MKESKIITSALIQASGIFAYTALVTFIMYNGEQWFGKEDNILMPMLLLMMFVVSATIVGLLMFGRSILLYLNGSKTEAVKLIGYTVGFSAVYTILIFTILILIK